MSESKACRFRFYGISVLVWTVALLLLCYLRHSGIDEFDYIETVKPYNVVRSMTVYGSVGFFFGLLYAFTDGLFERRFFARQSYGKLLLIKIFLYFLLLKILFVGIVLFLRWSEWNSEMVVAGLRSKNYWVALTYTLVVGAVFTFVRQMSQKFGPGVLWKLVKGSYRSPREEERIFMFLDLKSSVTIADQLGHVQFSRFIQDCFVDMTDALRKNGAEVYQYVGDEIIVSWPKKKGLKENAALRCFFDIREYLRGRSDYYETRYGVQPVFKAGMHLGWVTVAEVGVLKREISYHGDTLNTTARIEGRCNDFEQDFLVSGGLVDSLESASEFSVEELGNELLRGKKEPVKVFGISLS